MIMDGAPGLSRREWVGGISAGLAGSRRRAKVPEGEPPDWELAEAAQALANRAVSSEELTKLCFGRIYKYNTQLNAFITITEDQALREARRADQQRAKLGSRDVPLLLGIPIALKDNIDTAGVLTTAASRVFRDRVPTEDAEVTRRLKLAGAVFLGKLNLDEFAFEGTGTTSCFGPVHNPWNRDRITGGSSAGSAAAVSAGLCFASVGSDDGGSVRIPASYCGVAGFKTSYGRVSTRGVIPSAYSLDTMGPITRSVADAAILLQVIAGYDARDSITADLPVPDYFAAMQASTHKLRLGVPRDYFFEELHPDVQRSVEDAIRTLRPHVAEIRDVALPRFQFVPDGSYDVELLHYQAQFFDRTPELYHPWSQRQLTELRKVKATNYVETLKRIREARRDIRMIFEEVDALVLPTMREPAPPMVAVVNETHKRRPSNLSAFNRFGTPAISVCCGFSEDRLPLGVQIVAPAFHEGRALAVALLYQRLTEWHKRRPPILKGA